MSALDRILSAIKDVVLLREQMKELRTDMEGLAGGVGDLVGDIRNLEQRVARLEGVEKAILAIASRAPRLPEQ